MDKLEQAMQSEKFWIELADTSFGKVVRMEKIIIIVLQTMSITKCQARINTDGDFAITFFKSYERMKVWLDEWQGEGFYKYLVKLYEKELEKELEKEWN